MKKLIILLAMCTGGYAMAQNDNGTFGKTKNEVTYFLKKAEMTNHRGIKAGNMAMEKGLNPQVRSFGEMMVRDHTNSSAELRAIAGRKNVTLPMHHNTMSHAGAPSDTYMGTEGQSSYTKTTTVTRSNKSTGTISARSYRGTANMKLSKAQTTPSRTYYNGVPTYWTDKDVNITSTTVWSDNSGASNTSSMGISGQDMTTGTINSSTTTTTVTTYPDEPGVSSSGTLGVSGTTGTLTTNADFNGATMWPDETEMDFDLADMEDDNKDKMSMLSGKSGAEFDRAYMNMTVSDHSKAIQLYQKAANSNDADIRAFAVKMLPALRQHHAQAITLSTTVNSSNSGL